LCNIQFNGFGQSKIDSLNSLLLKTTIDTDRIDLYLQLAEVCDIEDNLKYCNAGIEIADRLLRKSSYKKYHRMLWSKKADFYDYVVDYYKVEKDSAGTSKSLKNELEASKRADDTERVNSLYNELSNYYYSLSDFPLAIEYLNEAIKYTKTKKSPNWEAEHYRTYARYYEEQGDYEQALKYNQLSLAIAQKLPFNINVGYDFISIGSKYGRLKKYKQANASFDKALRYSQGLEEEDKMSVQRFLYNVMGLTYMNNNENDKAIIYFKKALTIAEKFGEKSWLRGILSNLGDVYRNKGDYKEALNFHFKALQKGQETGDENQLPWGYYNLAIDYLKIKEYKEAKRYNQMNLQILVKYIYFKSYLKDAELLAARIDSSLGNYNEAYFHYYKYIDLRDMLRSEEMAKVATKEKFQSEYDKKKAEDKVKQDKKDILAQNEMRQQKIYLNVFIGGFVFVMLLAFIVFRNYRQKRRSNIELSKKNIEIEEKNKEIMDSIRYAKRIQNALLPTNRYIQRILSERKEN
jgi:tetratricopeptide (TPR) repeat protein